VRTTVRTIRRSHPRISPGAYPDLLTRPPEWVLELIRLQPIVELPIRIVFAFFFGKAAWNWVIDDVGGYVDPIESRFLLVLVIGAAALGAVIAPYVSTRPLILAGERIRTVAPYRLFGGVAGFLAGAIIARLVLPAGSTGDEGLIRWLPEALVLALGAGFALVFSGHPGTFRRIWRRSAPEIKLTIHRPVEFERYVVDYWALVDGRIVDILGIGFIGNRFIVPRAVQSAIKSGGESGAPTQARRARRTLNRVAQAGGQIEYIGGTGPIDESALGLSEALELPLITADDELARRAATMRIRVLNIAALARNLQTKRLPSPPPLAVRPVRSTTGKHSRNGR
jgi:uncharacterized protein YacL